jgi:hypothetical protein
VLSFESKSGSSAPLICWCSDPSPCICNCVFEMCDCGAACSQLPVGQRAACRSECRNQQLACFSSCGE